MVRLSKIDVVLVEIHSLWGSMCVTSPLVETVRLRQTRFASLECNQPLFGPDSWSSEVYTSEEYSNNVQYIKAWEPDDGKCEKCGVQKPMKMSYEGVMEKEK